MIVSIILYDVKESLIPIVSENLNCNAKGNIVRVRARERERELLLVVWTIRKYLSFQGF